jgi:hypothetical protein
MSEAEGEFDKYGKMRDNVGKAYCCIVGVLGIGVHRAF